MAREREGGVNPFMLGVSSIITSLPYLTIMLLLGDFVGTK